MHRITCVYISISLYERKKNLRTFEFKINEGVLTDYGKQILRFLVEITNTRLINVFMELIKN